MRYLLIIEDRVVATVIGPEEGLAVADHDVVVQTDELADVGIGWSRTDGVFTAPPVVEPEQNADTVESLAAQLADLQARLSALGVAS